MGEGLFWGSEGSVSHPPEAIGVLGAEPSVLEKSYFIFKNNLILGQFELKLMLLKCGVEISSAKHD